MPFHSSIHRIYERQQLLQPNVGHISCHYLVNRTEKIDAVSGKEIFSRAEVEYVHLSRHTVHEVDKTLYTRSL